MSFVNGITGVKVIGAGTMGSGIAQVFAQSGLPEFLFDPLPAARDKAKATIEQSLGRLVKKEKIAAAAAQKAVRRIKIDRACDRNPPRAAARRVRAAADGEPDWNATQYPHRVARKRRSVLEAAT